MRNKRRRVFYHIEAAVLEIDGGRKRSLTQRARSKFLYAFLISSEVRSQYLLYLPGRSFGFGTCTDRVLRSMEAVLAERVPRKLINILMSAELWVDNSVSLVRPFSN